VEISQLVWPHLPVAVEYGNSFGIGSDKTTGQPKLPHCPCVEKLDSLETPHVFKEVDNQWLPETECSDNQMALVFA